ncbi:hypothetical protein WDD9_002746 [Paenibacillus melissococcoides]|nr:MULTISPECIES: hypothetical protein [Paenibacillus]CAH8710925.1 hypothetical protein WDD9_002746 [Paenibacillus melissococcoides]CAH8711726.1 hypothetical protein HTL2_003047 [Paenibacillus melissococcoides]
MPKGLGEYKRTAVRPAANPPDFASDGSGRESKKAEHAPAPHAPLFFS